MAETKMILVRRTVAVVFCLLLITGAAGPAVALPSPFTAELRQVSLQAAAAQGAADAITAISQQTSVPAENQLAAEQAAIGAAATLETSGVPVTTDIVRSSSYGAVYGALEAFTAAQGTSSVVTPAATAAIVRGSVLGTTQAAVQASESGLIPTQVELQEAARGAANGATNAVATTSVLLAPSLEQYLIYGSFGAAWGALLGWSMGYQQGGVVILSNENIPTEHLYWSAYGAAEGVLEGLASRSTLPAPERVEDTASKAAYDAMIETAYNLEASLEITYGNAYNKAFNGVVNIAASVEQAAIL